MTATDSICECCQKQKAIVGVASVPGIPMSIAWCQECLDAGVIPYWFLVTNTALVNGLENSADWWKAIVAKTLKYFNKTDEEFANDVAVDMAAMLAVTGEPEDDATTEADG